MTPVRLELHIDEAGYYPIDLDEPGWMAKYKEVLAAPGVWMLHWKDGSRPPLMMTVSSDDEPFYSAHHVGLTGSGGSNEIIAYGIGKTSRSAGEKMSIWALPGGPICGGDDVDRLGIQMVRALGPRPVDS